jgi:uncharacterized protein (DUF885 family)
MNPQLRDKIDEILNFWYSTKPTRATMVGIHDYDCDLERLDPDSRKETLSRFEGFVSDLESLEVSSGQLDADELLDLRLVRNCLDATVKFEREYRQSDRDATVYPDLCEWSIYSLLMRDFAPLEERMESALKRLRQIPRLIDEGKANLTEASGIPEIWTRLGMEVTQAGMGFYTSMIPMMAAEVPSISGDIRSACDNAVAALDSYARFLRDEIMPRSDGEFCLGEEMFDYLLKHDYMLSYTSDELVEVGREYIESTLEELRQAAAEIEPGKDWKELIDEFRMDTPSAEDLIDYYRREAARARQFIVEKNIVSIPEGEKLEFDETPESRRSRLPYAAYVVPAAFEGGQTGTFWVTPINTDFPSEQQREQLLGHPKPAITVIAIHEGYPGHHLQLVRSNLIDSRARKAFGSDVFIEGWALYCEEMMYEQGFYDFRSRLFMLKHQLWRACRVVIDVELHRGNMGFQEAVRMLVDIVRVEEVNAISEVKRYTQSPTQPMSYLTGKIELMKLREEYREKAGGDFDLRAFHDRLLSFGSIPVGLIADRMLK